MPGFPRAEETVVTLKEGCYCIQMKAPVYTGVQGPGAYGLFRKLILLYELVLQAKYELVQDPGMVMETKPGKSINRPIEVVEKGFDYLFFMHPTLLPQGTCSL